jgi:hypothetical protein
MAKTTTVELTTPLGAGGAVKSFTFREPRYEDYMALGDPETVMRTAEGGLIYSDTPQIISAYAERLLLPPADPNHMALASLTDTLKIRDTILGFFREARAEPNKGSGASPDTSSGAAASTPAPSSG